MKGQMFLLTAVIMIGIIVIMKANIRTPSAIEQRRAIEARLENEIFKNVLEEFNNTIHYSYRNASTINSNVFDFGNFTRYKMTEHSLELKILYVGTIANKTTQIMNITFINLLGNATNASLTLNSTQTNNISNIPDYGEWDNTNFTFSKGSNYILTVKYGQGYSTNVTIETHGNKDVYVGFFDISLENEDIIHKAKYHKRYVLK